MSYTPTVAFVCGSLRTGSINAKLETALMHKASEQGLAPERVGLADYALPIYNGDLELPDNATKLAARLERFDAVVIVSPEYNGSLPPVLKNAIDWTSTVGSRHFREPVYGVASCAPGAMSGIMCMRQMAYILTRLGAEVVPTQVGVGVAAKAFMDNGRLVEGRSAELADTMLASLRTRVLQKRALDASPA